MCKQNIKFNLRDIVERVFFLSCLYITTHSSTPGSLSIYICHESVNSIDGSCWSPYPHCSVLAGSRTKVDLDFTTELN